MPEANPNEEYRSVDDIDSDIFSIVEVTSMMKELVVEDGSDSSSGSDSEDNDYFVDEENLIDDVNVDMAEFKKEVDHEDFDSGSDSDEDDRRKALRKVGRMNQAKFSKVEQRRQLWLKKNDKLKVRVVCRGHVPDFANNNMGTIVPVTCNPKGPTSKVQPKSISKKEKVTKPKESYGCPWAMQVSKLPNEDTWEKNFKVGVSKQKVFRAKKMAYEKVVCNYTQQYAQLRGYCIELKEINPNTTVKIESRGRDFLGLDGCFPSGPYPGQIHTVVGEDPNNGIYPLAYVVVESESKDSWKWFLDCLVVIPAIAETFPSVEHRCCLKHIYDNMKLSWRGKLYKELLWKCAMATTIQKFDKRIEEMKNHNIEAYEWLRKIPPQHWARSHFTGRAKSNILLNNLCEVLNRQLLDGRDKPIITCLEYIREYLMKRIVNVQKVQDKCDGPLTPSTAKIFKLIVRAAAKLKVEWNGSDLYQVTCPWGDQFVVNMTKSVYSCRKWELSGIPCTHAVAAIWDMASNGTDTGIPESYYNPCHWLSTWKKMYRFKINPINGPQAWKKSDVPTTIIPPKPHLQIGRPPKKRKKSAAQLADEIMKSNKMTRPHRQHRLQLEEDARVKKGDGDVRVGGSQTTQTTQSSF
ncbi:mutator type transposase [Tanacetum coccineum]